MKMAARLLWRDFKSGQLHLLLLSLIIAVATVSGIGLFASRIQNSILNEATQILAGDGQIVSSQPNPSSLFEQAATYGLQHASTTVFRAMTFSQQQAQLATVKAVSDRYPLKGELTIADTPFGEPRRVVQGPAPGEAWLTSRLFALLELAPGDRLEVGEASFRVTQALISEPDHTGSLFNVAPRVMIHEQDVSATGAVQEGSRITYRLIVAGDQSRVQAFAEQIKPELGMHQRWADLADSDQGITQTLDKAQSFLYLSGSLAVLLASVAIALAARRYAKQRVKPVALLKTLGLPPAAIVRLYGLQLLVIGVVGVALGSLAGWLCHLVIAYFLQGLISTLAAPSASAYWISLATGMITLLGFAAPPLLALRNVTPAAVLRAGDAVLPGQALQHIGIGFAATLALIWLYSGSLALTFFLSLGTLLCLLAASLVAAFVSRALARLGRRFSHSLKLGFVNLERHRRINTPQITLFSILFMLLFTLVLIRTSLLTTWQDQLPPDAPNHFVFNVFTEQKPQISALFADAGVAFRPFFPMVRGRLTAINSDDIETRIEQKSNDVNYERELFLTWTRQLSSDNKLVAGQWWSEDEAAQTLQVSLEKSFAEGLDMQVGDRLQFSVSGDLVEAEVSSVREVRWDTMNPNFYVIFNQPVLEDAAANWLTSFYLPAADKPFVNDLVRRFPTITLVEIDQTIAQIQSIVERVSRAVEFIWLLVLAAGILVLITGIQSTLDTRLHEGGMLRTLGASKSLVRKLLLTEFASIGLMAGTLAVLGTELVVYLLQKQLFDLDFRLHPELWLAGPLLAVGLITAVGLASTREIVRVPPMAILRRSD